MLLHAAPQIMPGALSRCRWATLAMLARAFLVVTALTDQARDPAPPGLSKLTYNEIQHLFAALVADTGHRLRWPACDADTKPAPVPATTAGRPAGHEDHELQLD
jgi:hypothetical protein